MRQDRLPVEVVRTSRTGMSKDSTGFSALSGHQPLSS